MTAHIPRCSAELCNRYEHVLKGRYSAKDDPNMIFDIINITSNMIYDIK